MRRGPKVKPIERKLLSKIFYSPDGCWYWTAALNHDGYGVGVTYNGKTHSAHRVSYEFHKGPIPKGMYVLHNCDNRMCVNPDHLFIGTQLDNMTDMIRKGRYNGGGKRGINAKLNKSQVLEIFNSKEPAKKLAEKYGVSHITVSAIKAGKTRTDITLSQPLNP